jgi:hypothetical protein
MRSDVLKAGDVRALCGGARDEKPKRDIEQKKNLWYIQNIPAGRRDIIKYSVSSRLKPAIWAQ